MRGSIKQSYLMQAMSEKDMSLPAAYSAPRSVDAWRHRRMLEMVDPLIAAMPNSTWMTVGDGRYGCDAAHLRSRGVAATATSLTSEKLESAREMGFIESYAVENAEDIARPDSSFDFLLCKESYHHFPRPPVALYEMLRVSRVGVVLIEPFDNPRPLDALRSLIKRVLRGNASQLFEPSGNFIYRPSLRELRKLLLAMGGQVIAWRGFNDFYHRKLAGGEFSASAPAAWITRGGILAQDLLASSRLMGWGLACIVVFKDRPDARITNALRRAGFDVDFLPENPYAGSAHEAQPTGSPAA